MWFDLTYYFSSPYIINPMAASRSACPKQNRHVPLPVSRFSCSFSFAQTICSDQVHPHRLSSHGIPFRLVTPSCQFFGFLASLWYTLLLPHSQHPSLSTSSSHLDQSPAGVLYQSLECSVKMQIWSLLPKAPGMKPQSPACPTPLCKFTFHLCSLFSELPLFWPSLNSPKTSSSSLTLCLCTCCSLCLEHLSISAWPGNFCSSLVMA